MLTNDNTKASRLKTTELLNVLLDLKSAIRNAIQLAHVTAINDTYDVNKDVILNLHYIINDIYQNYLPYVDSLRNQLPQTLKLLNQLQQYQPRLSKFRHNFYAMRNLLKKMYLLIDCYPIITVLKVPPIPTVEWKIPSLVIKQLQSVIGNYMQQRYGPKHRYYVILTGISNHYDHVTIQYINLDEYDNAQSLHTIESYIEQIENYYH